MATTTTAKPAARDVGYFDVYLALCRELPLAPIRDDDDLTRANAAAGRLAVRGEDDLNDAEADYLDVLSDLIESYERRRFADLHDEADPVDVLGDLLDAHGMTASDLGLLLGNRSLGSKLLRRERGLSKAHCVKLAERFGVSPALFLRRR